MEFYVLTINNCEKVHEVSNEGINWMLSQFRKIKYTIVTFTINEIL